MNIKIIDKEEWNVSDIDERTNDLIKEICKVYPYETAGEIGLIKYSVSYDKKNCKIKANLYENMSLEILEGSYFEYDGISRESLMDLINDNIISEFGNGFVFNETIQCPFETYSKKLTGNNDIWSGRKDSKGRELSFEIKAKVLNSSSNKK